MPTMTTDTNPTTKIRRRRAKPIKAAYAKPGDRRRDATQSLEDLKTRRIAEAKQTLDKISEMLIANHHAIDTCADLLNISQPPMAGKIEVRWWKDRGNGQKVPTVVQWGQNGLLIKLGCAGLVGKCNSRGAFEVNLPQTKLILSILEDVLASREVLLGKLSHLTRGMNQVELFHDGLAQITYQKKTFHELYEQITENKRKHYDKKP